MSFLEQFLKESSSTTQNKAASNAAASINTNNQPSYANSSEVMYQQQPTPQRAAMAGAEAGGAGGRPRGVSVGSDEGDVEDNRAASAAEASSSNTSDLNSPQSSASERQQQQPQQPGLAPQRMPPPSLPSQPPPPPPPAAGMLGVGAGGLIQVGPRPKSHQFLIRTFSSPLKCNHCTSLMVGLTRQGVVCEVCGFACHIQCREKVPTSCPVPPDQSKWTILRLLIAYLYLTFIFSPLQLRDLWASTPRAALAPPMKAT